MANSQMWGKKGWGAPEESGGGLVIPLRMFSLTRSESARASENCIEFNLFSVVPSSTP